MKLLAIDTATEACSAAIAVEDDIVEEFQLAPRQHANLVLQMVDNVLQKTGLKLSEIDAFAFGRGPGAFTGLRIACGVIQGLAFGCQRPVIPVSTLAALAQSAPPEHPCLLSAIDARMGEIYWCAYQRDNGVLFPMTEETVSCPSGLKVPGEGIIYGIGSGWASYQDDLSGLLGPRLGGFDGACYPHAGDILRLAVQDYRAGRTVPAEQGIPVYLRDRVTG